jgi:ribose transport system ATP-binding protein
MCVEHGDGALLELSDIWKIYPGVNALSGISFDVRPGEVHCICGENGAGKSTLIKVVSGAHQPDSGSVYFEGRPVTLSPRSAVELGIHTIYQELNYYRHLDVVENIFSGAEVTRRGLIQKNHMRRVTEEALSQLNCAFSPDSLMSELSSGEQKLVEIAKAMIFKRKLLILDEPTASLSSSETSRLLGIVSDIRKTGLGIIYISHHLDEIFAIGDRVTVLRDGRKISERRIADIDEPGLIRDMVGRDASAFYTREYFERGDVVLEASNLTGNGVRDVSFSLRGGEILGFAGMVGSGRSELMTLIFGGAPPESGSLKIFGGEVKKFSPRDSIRRKICYITEDRQRTGLFLQHTVARNTIIANLVNTRELFRPPSKDAREGDEYIGKLGIRAENSEVRVVNLSGGNQQKVVLAKWFLTGGEIYIFDEPTRGIDVGAKQEIYAIMLRLASEGKAIIMVSSDMPEVVSMSDRVMVMRRGELVGSLERDEISEENILAYSIGGTLN